MNTYKLKIILKDEGQKKTAQEFSARYNLPLVENVREAELMDALEFAEQGISLVIYEQGEPLKIKAEFAFGGIAHRRQYGGGKGQAIAKAIGLTSRLSPNVLDVTAGLGKDAFVLATLGAHVTLLERSPAVHLLLKDGLDRARIYAEESQDIQLRDILTRMQLIETDGVDFMATLECSFDVIYLDPMFPQRDKSALVKKDMRVFHRTVGADRDADQLLALALQKATYRVVVKRPRLAPFLADRLPNYQIKGKSSRFDIYTLQTLPKHRN